MTICTHIGSASALCNKLMNVFLHIITKQNALKNISNQKGSTRPPSPILKRSILHLNQVEEGREPAVRGRYERQHARCLKSESLRVTMRGRTPANAAGRCASTVHGKITLDIFTCDVTLEDRNI